MIALLIFLVMCFAVGYAEVCQPENELKECTMTFEEICKKSSVLCVSQYTSYHVQIEGVSISYKLYSRASEIVTEICNKYGYRLVNVEGTRVFHLAKI